MKSILVVFAFKIVVGSMVELVVGSDNKYVIYNFLVLHYKFIYHLPEISVLKFLTEMRSVDNDMYFMFVNIPFCLLT